MTALPLKPYSSESTNKHSSMTASEMRMKEMSEGKNLVNN